ncbi:MAG TPA: hypothetical protein VK639_21510 [Terriglobales bacterium]|nr:hypothetical protein [Terriglobales bacterium]
MTTADVDGIDIAGLLFDAGPSQSPVLLEVGPEGSRERHAKDPITLHDVFFRVGGAGVGRAKVNLRINSNNTLVDHTWIWRADHGAGVGWELNTSENGLVVNGNESRSTACLWSITSSSRFYGRAMAGERIFINPRFLTILRTRVAIRVRPG